MIIMSNKIGFQFKKVSKPKSVVVVQNVPDGIGDNEEHGKSNENRFDFVTSIDDRKIQGTGLPGNDPRSTEPLVIPLIRVNKYRFPAPPSVIHIKPDPDATVDDRVQQQIKQEPVDEKDDLLSQAKRELIQQARQPDADVAANGSSMAAWQSLLINKLPDEYENDDRCDVSMRPEAPALEDYEQIPVEAFGSAMLRGMGWKAGQPIGGINKAVTPIIEPQLRPRGLGLGADISLKKQLEESNKRGTTTANKDEPILKRGCHVRVQFGPHKDTYGIVESISDDLAYASIKTSFGGSEPLMLPPETLRVVTKKEYDTESKVINRTKYEKYKRGESKRTEAPLRMTNEAPIGRPSKPHAKSTTEDDEVWIVPRIRAQIIDKLYKEGRYYKEKIVILETNGQKCVGITKRKKVLKNICQSQLRTVIPSQSSSSYVLILRGQHKGKMAHVDTVDWDRQSAIISLAGFLGKPIPISLDDISEFYDSD